MSLPVTDLGRLDYAAALRVQTEMLEQVLASRDTPNPLPAHIFLVEHDPPVITVSRRAGSRANLLASDEHLASRGVTLAETDRGGDITYHGPGQLVVYPIVDLNAHRLGLHAYMRLLEEAVIQTCREFGVVADRDPKATGVWVVGGTDLQIGAKATEGLSPSAFESPSRKICAMGVRVRRWVSMHGLALNVDPDMSHFSLIIPCGLVGRPVTSLRNELGDACPPMPEVKTVLVRNLTRQLEGASNRQAG